MKHYDIISVADMCVDLIVSGNVRPQFSQIEQLVDQYHVCMGGSTNIFASQYAKLGGSIAVIGKVGQDTFGHTLLDQIQASGIRTEFIQQDERLNTGLGIHLDEITDRAILTFLGSIDAVHLHDLCESHIERCDHWHIASYFLLESLQAFWPEWCRRLRQAGKTISLDSNWAPDGNWEQVKALLPLVDVFLPNEQEALAISGCINIEDAARFLAQLTPTVVIKCGADGAIACVHGELTRCSSLQASAPIKDCIGAGDSFDGGFLYAWLRNRSTHACLSLANACGVANIIGTGGCETQLEQTRFQEHRHDTVLLS